MKSSNFRLEIRNLKQTTIFYSNINLIEQNKKENYKRKNLHHPNYLYTNVNNAYQIASAQNGPKATRSNLCKCQHFPAIWIILPFVHAEKYPETGHLFVLIIVVASAVKHININKETRAPSHRNPPRNHRQRNTLQFRNIKLQAFPFMSISFGWYYLLLLFVVTAFPHHNVQIVTRNKYFACR